MMKEHLELRARQTISRHFLCVSLSRCIEGFPRIKEMHSKSPCPVRVVHTKWIFWFSPPLKWTTVFATIARRDVVNLEQTTISYMVRATLRASAEITKVLIGAPHVVTAHCTVSSLEEHAAASSAVAPTASSFGTTTIGDR